MVLELNLCHRGFFYWSFFKPSVCLPSVKALWTLTKQMSSYLIFNIPILLYFYQDRGQNVCCLFNKTVSMWFSCCSPSN